MNLTVHKICLPECLRKKNENRNTRLQKDASSMRQLVADVGLR